MNDPPRPPLRLVHPAKPQAPAEPRRRHDTLLFSPEENARLRAALRNARAMFGTWACLADAMYVQRTGLREAASGTNRVSGAIAIRLARALGIPLESLLRGLTSVPKVCPHCGRGGAP